MYKHDDDDDEKIMWLKDAANTKDFLRTCCTLNKNLFDVIIDNRSCENIIGRLTVDKFKLTLEPHPEPYKNEWI